MHKKKRDGRRKGEKNRATEKCNNNKGKRILHRGGKVENIKLPKKKKEKAWKA